MTQDTLLAVSFSDSEVQARESLAPARLGAALAVVAFTVYMWRGSLAPYLLDSAELAAASFGLGVAHPPGEGLALLWGRLFSFLPLGTVALRVSLGQSVCGALAVALLYFTTFAACQFLPSLLQPQRRVRAAVCAACALAFAFSPGAADVCSRPEVYALATLLALATLVCAQQAAFVGDARWAVGAAFLLGLSMANHPLIAGTAGVGALAACVPLLPRAYRTRERVALVVAAVVAFACGALFLLYVPVRTAALFADPNAVLWGDARTWRGWWWVLSARTFAEKSAIVHGSADPSSLPFLFVEELGIAAACLGFAGAYSLARFSRAGRFFALTTALSAAGAIASALVGGLDPHNPDVRGYLGSAFALWSLFAGVGACALATRVGRLQTAVAALLGMGVVAPHFIALAADASFRDGVRAIRSPERLITEAAFSLPPRTVLTTGHFETAFLLAYNRAVQGQRPDVQWFHAGWANAPGYAERIARFAPALSPLVAGHGVITSQSVEALSEPFATEASVPLSPELPAGLTYGEQLWHWPPLARLHADLPVASTTPLNPQVKGFIAWRLFQDARLACKAQSSLAPSFVAQVQSLLPDDAVTAALPTWCAQQRGAKPIQPSR
ncbi:MAG: DUF2723 domain-containing protein [Deltaproteobacteria bacterium]|nr:DUF2723 domain-containing protein [Deltaproteobacteria bacterium]